MNWDCICGHDHEDHVTAWWPKPKEIEGDSSPYNKGPCMAVKNDVKCDCPWFRQRKTD